MCQIFGQVYLHWDLSLFAVIVSKKPDWPTLNRIWCSKTAATTLCLGQRCHLILILAVKFSFFHLWWQKMAFSLSTRSVKGCTRGQNVNQSRNKRLSRGDPGPIVTPFKSVFGMSVRYLPAKIMSGN